MRIYNMEHGTWNMEQIVKYMKQFHDQLKQKMDEYVHLVYQTTRNFPKEELYGVTSQLRRAALSVILNYIEGYARQRGKIYKNFLETSYGSLRESLYLLDFSSKEKYLSESELRELNKLGDEIGAMLWSTMKNMDVD